MIQAFKVWISSLLCLGIFVTFLELIMPNSKFKKYIYALVGIITIITIVSPIVKLYKDKNLETSINDVTKAMSNDISNQNDVVSTAGTSDQQQLVKSQFIDSLKKDITSKLTLQGVNVDDVEIEIDSSYNITKLNINIKKLNPNIATIDTVNKVVDYINKEYDIDYSKIFVVEKGE